MFSALAPFVLCTLPSPSQLYYTITIQSNLLPNAIPPQSARKPSSPALRTLAPQSHPHTISLPPTNRRSPRPLITLITLKYLHTKISPSFSRTQKIKTNQNHTQNKEQQRIEEFDIPSKPAPQSLPQQELHTSSHAANSHTPCVGLPSYVCVFGGE